MMCQLCWTGNIGSTCTATHRCVCKVYSEEQKESKTFHCPSLTALLSTLCTSNGWLAACNAADCAVPCCHMQGLMHARITFKNEASGEYTYYEVKLTSTAPAPMGRLSLECPVRKQTSATVSINNPLTVPVTLRPTITSKQVRHSAGTTTCNSLQASPPNQFPVQLVAQPTSRHASCRCLKLHCTTSHRRCRLQSREA